MALSGLRTRRTRRIFTTLMALDLKESIGRFERHSNVGSVQQGQNFEILHSLRLHKGFIQLFAMALQGQRNQFLMFSSEVWLLVLDSIISTVLMEGEWNMGKVYFRAGQTDSVDIYDIEIVPRYNHYQGIFR